MAQPERISIGTEHDAVLKLGAEKELATYRETRELPEQFIRADIFLTEQIQKETPFYQHYRGMYVVLRSVNPLSAEIGVDIDDVRRIAYRRWGDRLLMGKMMDPEAIREQRGPSPRAFLG